MASSDDAIVSKDLNGIITSWNRGAERLFGYTAEEALGRAITMLIPEDRLDEEPGILARIRRGERVEHYETIRRRKDGSLVEISLTVSPLVDSTGTIVGASKIARDITERRQAARQLAESEERYRRLAELLPVGVYTCAAPAGTITYYNEHAATLWGRRPAPGDTDERFCGSHKLYLPDGTLLPHADCPMAVAVRQGRSFRNEEVIIERHDGSRVTALVNIDPIVDASGHVLGAINVFHDVSALKRAERSLREQKENLQTLLDTIPIAVVIAHDSGASRITGNRAAEALLRMPPGANLSKSAPPDEAPSHFRLKANGREVSPHDLPVQRAARGEAVPSQELAQEFDDGTVRHLVVSAQPLFDATGRPRGAIACLADATDERRTADALRAADRRKDEFLAILAHELRNPLAPILTGLEVMKLARGDPSTLERVRTTMVRQTRQLIALVDDLMDVSRITRGKFELRKRRVAISEVVQLAVDSSRTAVDRAGHVLSVELPARPIHLEADPNRLAQVLSNLLNNAAKYTPDPGRIRLAVERHGNTASISVTDSGTGVPAEMQQSIFEMFAQLGRSHETGHSGLGVGLTLAKSLVELHGGTLEVQSEGLGRGSTFTVRLPVAAEDSVEKRKEAPDDDAIHASPKRVLVVDDNEAAAHMLSTMVSLLGHEVYTAADGRRALELAEQFRPHVVLMDLGMPGMSGYEAAERMRKQPWGADVTLVAVTGWGQEAHKQRTAAAGFDHHVVKPASGRHLQRLLADAPADEE